MNAPAAEPVRIVFFGTPAYAVPALVALAEDGRVNPGLVVTQPDRPAGRGRKLTPPPVKIAAAELGIPVYQPGALRTADDREPIASMGAELFVVAAYGKIFGPKLLAIPPLGCVNLHASLLPGYRGASPISAAILEGQFRTGVTLMRMDTGLDTGPILAERSIDILPVDTTASLTPQLAILGAELLIDSLGALVAGDLVAAPQDDAQASITRPMVKADGWIDWTQPAREIERQVRAMWDWPRAWTTLHGESIQIHEAEVLAEIEGAVPGTVSESTRGAVVATGDGTLLVKVAQRAGGKPMSGRDWMRQFDAHGERLGVFGQPVAPELTIIRPATS